MNVNRPNFCIERYKRTYPKLGDNNLMHAFYVMFSSCYSDLTKQSRFYNKMNSDNTSVYYVHQEEIENQMDMFSYEPNDADTYLVGFTGIGKTTLLKNHFKIVGSNPFINDKKSLIAYISVYSDHIYTKNDVDDVLERYLFSIAKELMKRVDFDFYNSDDIEKLKRFIEENKSRLLVPYDENLDVFRKEYAVEFYSMVVKYLLKEINNKERVIERIILIYDDIEAQGKSVHVPFIECALKISGCLRNLDDRKYVVKSIISLRNYTFRYHLGRQSKARRAENCVILKETVPKMKDIFEKRFNVYYDNVDVSEMVKNEKLWIEQTDILRGVVDDIADFGEMITALCHNDIAHSFQLFLQVLTNRRWFAPNEAYNEGAFALDKKDYLSHKERVFKALVYGEDDVYIDNELGVIRNFLAVHEEECTGVELLALYVLEYMNTLQRTKTVTLYGEARIKGIDLKNKIVNTLKLEGNSIDKLEYTISRLYDQEYLLHSIFEPEVCAEGSAADMNRIYDEDYGLYFSLRAKKVMDMLENDSLLFEVLRDDIDTSLPKNVEPSARLYQHEKLTYLISYCKQLFEIEQEYIKNSNQDDYFRLFGRRFVVSRLLLGIENTFRYFYKSETETSILIKNQIVEIYQAIISYKDRLLKNNENLMIDVKFMVDFLRQYNKD